MEQNFKPSIDYKFLIIIIGLIVIFHFYVNYALNIDDSDVVISIVSFINPMAVAIASFVISYRYGYSQIFGKSFLALGFGYLFVFFGEVIYLVYDLFLELDPYPSIGDVFFFMQYPLVLTHLILNLKFFISSFNKTSKLWLSIFPIVLIIGYSLYADAEIGEYNFDFYYGVIFVTAASVVFGFVILTSVLFRKGAIGTAWLILVLALTALTFGDIAYYYTELNGTYDLQHPLNLFWYAGYWILVYAIFIHKKVF